MRTDQTAFTSLINTLHTALVSQSRLSSVKVKVTLRLTVSQSVSLGVEPHLGLMTRYLLLFDSYGLVFLWGALSDERTGLSFYMLLTLASAVFLGSESLGTRDHILLSQIWDFPFRRLLWLTGGGIRPRLHMDESRLIYNRYSLYNLHTGHIENIFRSWLLLL
jgi:hypothetical protein